MVINVWIPITTEQDLNLASKGLLGWVARRNAAGLHLFCETAIKFSWQSLAIKESKQPKFNELIFSCYPFLTKETIHSDASNHCLAELTPSAMSTDVFS